MPTAEALQWRQRGACHALAAQARRGGGVVDDVSWPPWGGRAPIRVLAQQAQRRHSTVLGTRISATPIDEQGPISPSAWLAAGDESIAGAAMEAPDSGI